VERNNQKTASDYAWPACQLLGLRTNNTRIPETQLNRRVDTQRPCHCPRFASSHQRGATRTFTTINNAMKSDLGCVVSFLADRTATRFDRYRLYWHHYVVCPSIRLSFCL